MALHASMVKRLAFVKYLYRLGIEQSEAPEPLCGVALLMFHDSIELFMQLATEYLDVGDKQPNFMDYWELLQQRLPPDKELSQKEAMRRLNKARVALKHHGIVPTKLDIEAFKDTTAKFFEINTPLIFGVEFDLISLVDFVHPETAQANLKDAERFLSEGNLNDALGKIALAFQQLLDDYEARYRSRLHCSPFFFGRDLTFCDSISMGLRPYFHPFNDQFPLVNTERLAEFVDGVKESLEIIQETIKILALGIDYRRYSRFKFVTPHVHKSAAGKYSIVQTRHCHESTAEDVRFSLDFVVETALKLQEFTPNTPIGS